MWHEYHQPVSVEEVLGLLADHSEKARIVAGATDLILELEAGVRPGVGTLIDVTRIPDLDQIRLDKDGVIHLGPLVTHNHCVASKLIREQALPLAEACWQVGAPQIRNRGTVAGNLITASPANDTITPLMALGASVTLRSKEKTRTVPLHEFFTGVRKTVMQADEMMVDISFPALEPATQGGTFYKLALRRAQAISVVNVAVVLTLDGGTVSKAAITLGSVAPTIIHAPEAEAYLAGKKLEEAVIAEASKLVQKAAKPIDDLRGSAEYRTYMVEVSAKRALEALANGKQGEEIPDAPVLLWGVDSMTVHPMETAAAFIDKEPIETTINGKSYTFKHGHEKTLVQLLREEALLTGTKVGCAEGE